MLQVRNLRTSFFTDDGEIKAVDGVSFEAHAGKTLGLVGESGCGKSVACLSAMRLIPSPPGKIIGGEVIYKGRDLLKLTEAEMRSIRGNEISMVFQDPMTSLNPVFTVGNQIEEAIILHQKVGKKEARARAIEALRSVYIPSPETRIDDYPHQLSGGMRQRVMIAMALACNPQVLIADEPTTALDVTIQAQILDLLRDIQKKRGLALILITHDLGVVAAMADEVAVMYAGQVVEQGPVGDIFRKPKHPYTEGLMNSIPSITTRKRLEAIPGIVPLLMDLPPGCRFRDRCKYATDLCARQNPELRATTEEARRTRCLRDI